MTDQTTPPGEPQERQSPEELKIRSEHKQAIARIEREHEIELARLDREAMRKMPLPLRLLFDTRLREVVREAATDMASAGAFCPKHLQGNPQACAVVITKSITWRLDPYSVASATYVTPDGKIAFEGKLYRAIAEASGELAGPIRFQHYGDWSQIPRPSFKMVTKTRQSGGTYQVPEPLWQYYSEVENGLGVKISATLRTGEEMSIDFDLIEAVPRNATTWPTRPKQQILQAAMRAFVNNVRPSLIMGVPFRDDLDEAELGEPEMREINPRETKPYEPAPEKFSPNGHEKNDVYPAPQPVDLHDAIKEEHVDPETGEVTEAAPQPAQQQQAAPLAAVTVMGKPYVRLGSALNAIEALVEDAPTEVLRQQALQLRQALEQIQAAGRDVGDLPELLARRLVEAGPAPQAQPEQPAEPAPGSFEHWVQTMEKQAAGAPTAGVLSAYRKGRLAEAAVYQNHDEAVAEVERIFWAELKRREEAEAARAERMGG